MREKVEGDQCLAELDDFDENLKQVGPLGNFWGSMPRRHTIPRAGGKGSSFEGTRPSLKIVAVENDFQGWPRVNYMMITRLPVGDRHIVYPRVCMNQQYLLP